MLFRLQSGFVCGIEKIVAPNGNGHEKRFWTAKEAANYVGIAVDTLYGYCRYKPSSKTRISIPPYRRIGRNVLRFPVKEFIEWTERFDTPAQERKRDV